MDGDAVPEDVDVPSPLRQVRRRRVAPKKVIDHGGRDRRAWPPQALEQEPSRTNIPYRKVRPEKRKRLGMQSIRAGDPVLHAADPDGLIAKRDVVNADERDLASAQTVAIDEVEQQPISNILLRDRGEEPFDLFFRYVAYAGRARRREVSFCRHKAGEFDAFLHFGDGGKAVEGAESVWRSAVRRASIVAVLCLVMTVSAEEAEVPDERWALGEVDGVASSRETIPEEIATAADPTAACYPLTRPKTKRRAVGKGGPPCTSNPTLRLTVQPTACAGEAVRAAWQASEPNARVFLQGIACDLPPAGSILVTARESMTLRAMATTCAAGPETSARIEVEPVPEITSFAAEHAFLAPFAGTTFNFSYDHGEHWTIEEPTLADGPLGGAGSFGGSASAFFSFNSGGVAPVLTVTGQCGADVRTLAIPGCPAGTPETQIEFTGGSGRWVIGESVTLEFHVTNASRWWMETDNGAFSPASGGGSGGQTRYTGARAGLGRAAVLRGWRLRHRPLRVRHHDLGLRAATHPVLHRGQGDARTRTGDLRRVRHAEPRRATSRRHAHVVARERDRRAESPSASRNAAHLHRGARGNRYRLAHRGHALRPGHRESSDHGAVSRIAKGSGRLPHRLRSLRYASTRTTPSTTP